MYKRTDAMKRRLMQRSQLPSAIDGRRDQRREIQTSVLVAMVEGAVSMCGGTSTGTALLLLLLLLPTVKVLSSSSHDGLLRYSWSNR